ncbi:MAG: carbohydrate binding family 9 domain-containing protein, partial [Bacteroidota bacterium]
MSKQLTLLFCCALVCAHLSAQKTFQIPKLEQIPTLDGIANDDCWQKAGIADGFTTSTPVFGQAPAHSVSVRMFYADDALYIAATCGTDKLRDDGSARDAFAGDWFSVSLDTWNDDQHAFLFAITAGGAQIERQIAGADTETNWDAVWQSAVTRRADGWSVEMRIPFTALRFPKGNVQNWGLQFTCYDINKGELCTWNPQNPLIGDNALQ